MYIKPGLHSHNIQEIQVGSVGKLTGNYVYMQFVVSRVLGLIPTEGAAFFFFSLLVHQTCDKVVPRLEQFQIQGIDKVGTTTCCNLKFVHDFDARLLQGCCNLGISVWVLSQP